MSARAVAAASSRAEIVARERLASEDVATWRELAEARESPFLTPEWYEAWLDAHPDEEPFLVVWRAGGAVRGVLPLVRTAIGPVRALRFAGARRSDWTAPACDPRDEREMAAACAELLLGERRRWHLLRLDRLDFGSSWPAALGGEGPGAGLAVGDAERRDVLPYIRFEDGGYDAYLAGRSRNFRSQLGRRRRKLERDHGLTFRMTTEPAELERDLETFFGLHEERWRDRGGSSALSDDAKHTHRRFAAAALERGWLRLWIAEADGEPAAAWYGWRIGSRYCYSLSGLSGRYERLALGNVMLGHTIERAAAEGAEIYDLMWGDEDYKRRFETGRREAVTWTVGRRGSPAFAAAVAAARATARARELPPGLRDPLKRAYRLAVRR